jgi:ribosomal protein S12 methylthiotransferase accessory factor
MAEAAERYCARFRESDTTFPAALDDTDEKVIRLDELILLSELQKESFSDTCKRQNLKNPFLPSTVIDWSPAWSLSGNAWRLVPASTTYYPFPRNRDYMVPAWTTNGLSAGSCLEEAILQGLLEVIERDAFTIWWYNRLIPIGLDIHSFESPDASLMSDMLDCDGWDLHVLDLTSDLGVPVIGAVGINRTDPDRDPLFGFGANLDPGTALSRALGEMAAEWKSNANIFRMNENTMLYLGIRSSELDFIKPPADTPLLDASTKAITESDYLMGDIGTLTEILKQKGMETLVADLSCSMFPF